MNGEIKRSARLAMNEMDRLGTDSIEDPYKRREVEKAILSRFNLLNELENGYAPGALDALDKEIDSRLKCADRKLGVLRGELADQKHDFPISYTIAKIGHFLNRFKR